ncbi:twin-arginine translocation pathway signal protein [Niveispirillum lacus]|uniref:Murein endopeptidase K n=1 Tax=Niveispirillum lacus TaxID=1981099 RepID=A0A255Z3B3_9PROT|nr:DUF882 domain-containing protein [Niveispirillum lacus]OYQ35160.1 twin-arginine translocation pathway signal protein [Niveispirillum lacus]
MVARPNGIDLTIGQEHAPPDSRSLSQSSIDPAVESGRRSFLRGLGGLFLGAGAAIAAPAILTAPADAAPVSAPRRQLSFVSLHTNEKLKITYFANGAYDRSALKDVNHMLRDWRTGEVGSMDPKLLDLLFHLRQRLRTEEPFQVISGYRCPKTNAMLTSKSEGVATKSLHMEGKAIDITMAGRQLSRIRQEALNLRLGGVGIYSRSGFVHVDTGRVRQWGV